VLKCVINGTPAKIYSDPTTADRIFVHAFARKRRVLITRQGSTNVDFVTVDENLTPPFPSQSVDALSQPLGLASYDGGFVVLGLSYKSLPPRITATRFDDGAVNPDLPTSISPMASGLPNAPSDVSIAATPVDGTDDFFVVYSHASELLPNRWSMYAGRARIGSAAAAGNGTFKLVSDTLTARPSLESHLLLIDKPDNRAILFMAPDKGNGPASVVQLDLKTGALAVAPQTIPPIHGTSTFLPLAAQTKFGVAGGPDRAALAFLEYDLNSANQPLYGYAGVFPMAGIDKFKPTSLPPGVSFPGPSDVAVDKGTAFWTHYPAGGSHVVEAARFTNSGKGVNFLWFDGFGNLRGRATGPQALVPGDVVLGAAGTLVEAPSVLIGNAAVAWVTEGGIVRLANVGCSK